VIVFVGMAAAVPDGLYSGDTICTCDCGQCALSASQHVYHDMSFETAVKNLHGYRHAAHAMIYAVDDRVLFKEYRVVADIMVRHKL